MRENGFSNRIFKSFDAIFDHCHEAVVEGADAEAIPGRLCILDVEVTVVAEKNGLSVFACALCSVLLR
jgi:hypothetical protein